MSNVLFLSPHSDDETLFGSFIIQQELPEVWVILDGYTQRSMGKTDATSQVRRQETLAAVQQLIPEDFKHERTVQFGGFSDINPNWDEVVFLFKALRTQGYTKVYAPYPEPHASSHVQHNQLGMIAALVFGESTPGGSAPSAPFAEVVFYTTYTRQTGKTGHVTPNAREYRATSGVQIGRKHKALACYQSQLDVADCREHFLRDLKEYIVDYKPGEMWWEVNRR